MKTTVSAPLIFANVIANKRSQLQEPAPCTPGQQTGKKDVRAIMQDIEISARGIARDVDDATHPTLSDGNIDIIGRKLLMRNKSTYLSRHSRKKYEALLEEHAKRAETERDVTKQEVDGLTKEIAQLKRLLVFSDAISLSEYY